MFDVYCLLFMLFIRHSTFVLVLCSGCTKISGLKTYGLSFSVPSQVTTRVECAEKSKRVLKTKIPRMRTRDELTSAVKRESSNEKKSRSFQSVLRMSASNREVYAGSSFLQPVADRLSLPIDQVSLKREQAVQKRNSRVAPFLAH